MKALLQTGSSGRVPVPHEKRFLITLRSIVLASMIYLVGGRSNVQGDLVSVINNSGSPGIGGSEMFLKHQEGGSLGDDIYDMYWYMNERPPGSPDNWMRVYSNQNNQYYNVTGYEQERDSRPFSGENTNKIFPLVLDTQGPDPITSSNNYVRFELQQGPDTNRHFYHWNMRLTNGAEFADGTYDKSGIWCLTNNVITNLPYYHLNGVSGIYSYLNVLPSDVTNTNQYSFIFRDDRAEVDVTNQVPHGNSVATNIPLYIYKDGDTNSGVRYRATSLTVEGVPVEFNP